MNSVGERDVLQSDREQPGNTVTVKSSREKPQICPGRNGVGSGKAQLKFFCINVNSMGNKWKVMKAMEQLENYDPTAIIERGWINHAN